MHPEKVAIIISIFPGRLKQKLCLPSREGRQKRKEDENKGYDIYFRLPFEKLISLAKKNRNKVLGRQFIIFVFLSKLIM